MSGEGLLSVGAVLGGTYKVVRQLGRGGMAVVWLVEDKEKNLYALKEPIVKGVSPEKAKQHIAFIDHERKILAQISHPNVLKLYGAYKMKYGGMEPVIILTEYLDGGSLRDIKEPMSAKELRDTARQILEGLAAVHKLDIIHRDIKPSNIMRGRGGLKIVDFGTALHRFEKALQIVISPGCYTAPEQSAGESLPQSDVWSVGATLIYLATKELPYKYMKGYTRDCRKVGDIELELPDLGDDLLNQFLKKALHPDYKQRFADAADALGFLQGEAKAEKPGLKLRIKTHQVRVSGGRLYIGRTDDPKMDMKAEGEVLYIYDPNRYISRRHVEIAEINGKWFIRDLGSTNNTAIYRDGKWHVISKGKGTTSPWFELASGDIISLGYDEEKGPYIQIYVRI
ncbi:protein kinase [Pyrobaculum sp. 3827-6]|uniref:FHA domain-containing serine/threonine-protein kinase n=1 Tax=Pyrobaculum sp. 3827-6 TaxID=2983604 RepID=UPI0021D7E5C0|nr:FHA domain-containing serine/threonine-protein kinase [Pyrobaculum sp. 3827-6]MCU7786706.1 protein kinase [Pyrobaculum sp. 3827-6]